MSVLSAYCVFILLHCVSLCSVVFLYSLWVTFCLPVLTSRPFFQCEALLLHLYLKRCPRFVEVLFSCCIKALSLFFISRLRPHILCWGFVLVLYWGFVLIFYFEASASYFIWGFVLIFYFEALASYYIEASSSYFILRLRPRILFWGFVLIFYIEASSSYFILRLCPHILYWGFVLIFYITASSSYFILRLCPHILFWGFVLMFYIEASSSLFYIEAMFLSLRLWSSLF